MLCDDQLNLDLRREADIILHTLGLLRILERYGRPIVSGSYVLETMTWRDLDLYLECDGLDVVKHFKLGGDMAAALRPERMNFRNEIDKQTPGLPPGLYWGTYTSYTLESPWKIDVWSAEPDCIAELLGFQDDLLGRMDTENRQIIMSIKSQMCDRPEYRRSIKSVDIYQAVLDHGVTDIGGFIDLLKSRGTDIQ